MSEPVRIVDKMRRLGRRADRRFVGFAVMLVGRAKHGRPIRFDIHFVAVVIDHSRDAVLAMLDDHHRCDEDEALITDETAEAFNENFRILAFTTAVRDSEPLLELSDVDRRRFKGEFDVVRSAAVGHDRRLAVAPIDDEVASRDDEIIFVEDCADLLFAFRIVETGCREDAKNGCRSRRVEAMRVLLMHETLSLLLCRIEAPTLPMPLYWQALFYLTESLLSKYKKRSVILRL